MALKFKQITVARGEHTYAHQTYLFGLTEEGQVYQYVFPGQQDNRGKPLPVGWYSLFMEPAQ